MSFASHLESESESTETTLLIPEISRYHSLTRRKKLERLARVLGRAFNPLNDAAIGGIILYVIAIFFDAINIKDQDKWKWLPECTFSIVVVASLSSLVLELIHSYKLSKQCQLVLGECYYEHAKILIQELSVILDAQPIQDSQQPFEQWVMELKRTTHSELIKTHIKDFETANRYNNIRTLIDNIATLILGIGFSPYIARLNYRTPNVRDIVLITTMGTIVVMKTLLNKIEYNLFPHEDLWGKLSLSQKKYLLTFRTIIEILYHFILGSSVFTLFTDIVFDGAYFLSTSIEHGPLSCAINPIIVNWITPSNTIFPAFLIIPISIFSVIYSVIQLNSEHRC